MANERTEERVDLLAGIELSAGDTALVLHDLATGNGERIVTDPDVLARAQGRAFYTDDPAAATRLALLSILFLSPSSRSPHAPFATVLRDGETLERYTCFTLHCRGEGEHGRNHRRDLAGLLEASRPATLELASFDTPEEAWRRLDELRARADIILAEPPDWPDADAPWLSRRVYLAPAAVIVSHDPTADAAPLIDEAAYKARFRDAFTRAFPPGSHDYHLNHMRFSSHYPPESGWPVTDSDGTPIEIDGQPLHLAGYAFVQPGVTLHTDPAFAAQLGRKGALDALPDMGDEPPALARDLAALAESHGACASCYRVRLPATSVEGIAFQGTEPRRLHLSYYLIQAEQDR
ncbi:hypothetical protein K1T73_12405 [Roseovarius sp. SCSIO 43702]|uniref:hypothetical protein n=1 Tax=Roseovarius sp. SCSIO 43702 TaxID=2823043 RepID=UPI001C72DD52|nr:hypothetical protein [Roseovarius sp. SCSIO 43702]QYX55869.1 hypothetical protein K1T73_12405 [Roseovarius sp. SCSIO 43702]